MYSRVLGLFGLFWYSWYYVVNIKFHEKFFRKEKSIQFINKLFKLSGTRQIYYLNFAYNTQILKNKAKSSIQV